MRFLNCLIVLLFVSCSITPQLRVCNNSFEWDGVPNGPLDFLDPPICWKNCACPGATGNTCTVDHYLEDINTIGLAQDDSMFVGLGAWPNRTYNGESIGGEFSCNNLLINVKYNFEFFIKSPRLKSYPDSQGYPPPYLEIHLGNSLCDSVGQIAYAQYEYADTLHKWEKRKASFISNNNYANLRFGISHHFEDSTADHPYWFKTTTWLRLDNISDFTPDTLYNSTYTPIISNAPSGTICQGGILKLSSPYGNIADQHWYRDSTLIGSGENITDTVLNNARYYLVVGHSDTCVRSVLIKDISIKQDCEEIILPNAFSPNGDHNNDVWRVANPNYLQALGINIKQVQVYNRFGNKVYEANNNLFEWNGKDYAMDVYYYFVRYKTKNGESKTIKGDVTLVR